MEGPNDDREKPMNDRNSGCQNYGYRADHLKPKCPYYPESPSELHCPYFMMSSNSNMVMGGGFNGQKTWPSYASLTLGIIAICISWISIIPRIGIIIIIITLVFSILAIIFGGVGLRSLPYGARGRAGSVGGIILGIISIVLTLILGFLSIVMFSYY